MSKSETELIWQRLDALQKELNALKDRNHEYEKQNKHLSKKLEEEIDRRRKAERLASKLQDKEEIHDKVQEKISRGEKEELEKLFSKSDEELIYSISLPYSLWIGQYTWMENNDGEKFAHAELMAPRVFGPLHIGLSQDDYELEFGKTEYSKIPKEDLDKFAFIKAKEFAKFVKIRDQSTYDIIPVKMEDDDEEKSEEKSYVTKIKKKKFNKLVVRDFGAPKLDIAGEHTWMSKNGDCLIEYLFAKTSMSKPDIKSALVKYEYDSGKGHYISALKHFAEQYKYSMFVFDGDFRLRMVHKCDDHHKEVLCVQADMNHIYPLENPALQRKAYTLQKGEKLGELARKLKFDPEDKVIYAKTLNAMLVKKFDKTKTLPSCVRIDRGGNIAAFKLNGVQYWSNAYYDEINEVLEKVKELTPVREIWQFTNQSPITLFEQLVEHFGGVSYGLHKSSYTRHTYEMIHGPCNVRPLFHGDFDPEKFPNAKAFDTRFTHISSVLQRINPYPLYTILDSPETFNGYIQVGRYYYNAEWYLYGHKQVIKPCWIDSEALQYFLDNKIMEWRNIQYQYIPRYTIPCEPIKTAYHTLAKMGIDPKFIKYMVNMYIGALGRVKYEQYSGFVSATEESVCFTPENINYIPRHISPELLVCYTKTIKEVTQNHRPIYQAIVDDEYRHVDQMLRVLVNKNSIVHGIKTDCVIISNPNEVKLAENPEPGQMRKEKIPVKFEKEQYPVAEYSMRNPSFGPVKYFDTRPIDYEENTYHNDSKELATRIKGFIDAKKSMLIAGYAGSGKTWFLVNVLYPMLAKKNVAVTSVAHKALIKLAALEPRTVASLFPNNLSFDSHIELNKKWDYIIVDEWSMLDLNFMHRFYALSCIGVPIIFIGDSDNQITGVNNDQILFEHHAFFDDMINRRNRFRLMPHDKSRTTDARLLMLLTELRDTRQIPDWFREAMEKRKDVDTEFNIAYTNSTCARINKQYKRPRYFITNKTTSAYKNNEIIERKKNVYYSLDTGLKVSVDEDDLELGHCITIHRCQGSDLSIPYTIYGSRGKLEYRLFYTAVSRATSFDLIHCSPDIKLYEKPYEITKCKCITKKESTGYVYCLVRDDKIFYIGSTTNRKQRKKQHKEKYGDDIEMLTLKTVYFDDERELLSVEYHYLDKYCEQLNLINELGTKHIRERIEEVNKQIKMMKPAQLKKRNYEIKKGEDAKGCYLRINYRVDGKTKNAKKRYGKRISEKAARKALIEEMEVS